MNRQLDITELFQKKVQREEMRISVYDTILERIHRRIKHVASQDGGLTFTTFVLPEVMIGQPLFNAEQCRSFVITSLVKNGLHVRYNHPNLLLISWEHLRPEYEMASKVITEEQKKLLADAHAKAIEEERRRQEEYDARVAASKAVAPSYGSRGDPAKTRELLRATEDYVPNSHLKEIYFNKRDKLK